jgi:DNA-binding transcriptional ArsR family regulator
LLTKLTPGVETPAGKVRGLAAAAKELEAAGLVAVRKEGRSVMVSLTAAGAARVTELARAVVAKPTKSTKLVPSRAPSAASRIAALEETVATLAQRVAALEGARPHGANGGGTRAGDEQIRTAVLTAVGELDARHRYGGIVPIPDVRAELRRAGITDDVAVTAALEALERSWTIDLSVAQSPTAVKDRAAGIERPGRGLLYYVARR